MITRLVLLLALPSLLVACDSGPTDPGDGSDFSVEPAGLDGHSIWALGADETRFYAGTEQGLFSRSRQTGNTEGAGSGDEWTLLGLEGRRINAVLPDEDDAPILVATRPPDPEGDGDRTISLYRSSDGGETWEPDQRGFGGEQGPYEVASLARLPDGTLLAGGGSPVVARLEEGAATWAPVWNDWGQLGLGTHFVVVDPTDPATVWAGGEEAAFAPFLVKSTDGGERWIDVPIEAGGDNAINSLAVDPRDSDRVFAGWEGRVERTLDGGERWETVLEPDAYPYFFGLAVSPTTPGRVYAGGVPTEPSLQDLVFRWSDDDGETWSSVREEAAGGVQALMVVETADAGERILLGTQDGVYRAVP